MGNEFTFARLAVGVMLLAANLALGQTASAPAEEEIDRLVRMLGDDRWRVREEATEKLAKIGLPALPALRKAALGSDLEASIRALSVYRRLTSLDPNQLQAKRFEAEGAFRAGNYEEMAARYEELTRTGKPDLLDWLWLGHARQLAGQWPQAAAAYQALVKCIDESLQELSGGVPLTIWNTGELSAEQREQLRRSLLEQRAGLMWLIGRIQREEVKDAKAASETFARAAEAIARDGRDALAADPSGSQGRFRLAILRDLADTQERAGGIEEALKTWGRIHETLLGFRHWPGPLEAGFDEGAVIRLVGKLPPGKPVPPIAGLIVLSPQSPRAVLDLGKEDTRRRCYWPPPKEGDLRWWRVAFAPPPGMRFQTIRLEADFEQHTTGTPAHMYCSIRPHGGAAPDVHLGGIGWPRGAEPGRKTVGSTLQVPPGAGAVFVSTASTKDHTVHSIVAEANLVPRREDDSPLPRAIEMRTNLLPSGGRLTCDGQALTANPAVMHTRLAPGRHVFRYELPGRKEAGELEANLAPGARYSWCENLDTPFRAAFTDLRLFGDRAWTILHHRSLVQRADGRWLLAFSSREGKVLLAESNDLQHWGPLRPLPFNSIFRNHTPTLFVDGDGTIWLAWFSNRLHVESTSVQAGSRLWLTSSADGANWTRPRPISVGSVSEWPPDPVQMLRGPDGRVWMFWENLVASARSPKDIRDLEALPAAWATGVDFRDTNVTVAKEGGMHMLYRKGAGSLYCSSSKDGNDWSEPVQILRKAGAESARRGWLIVEGGAGCILLEQTDGAYIRSFLPGDPARLGPPLRITSAHAPLGGGGPVFTKDGRAILLAGADGVLALQAHTKDLLSPPRAGP